MSLASMSCKDSVLSAELTMARDSTNAEVLEELAGHHNNGVVRLVASNEATPGATLDELSIHPNASVREHLCSNPSTSLLTVQDLTMDSSFKVVKAAYKRLGIPFPLN